MFKALVVPEFGRPAEIRNLMADDLPDNGGDVVVRVRYSSLNYKDGLSVTSRSKVLRTFPCVPGIDLVGEVATSENAGLQPGDMVLATGYGIGENTWGGYSQYARLRSEWLVPLPAELSPERAMAIGTAGFTAMLAVMSLEEAGVVPESGDVLVTGAVGGVGSIAIAILATLGYRVVASTGRPQESDFLRWPGAVEIIERSALAAPTRPLESSRWAGAVDSVGGTTLGHILSEMKYGGAVACCGLAGGHELNTTVMPFILRAVKLIGVNSVDTPMQRRLEAWQRLTRDLPMDKLDVMTQTAPLADVPRLANEILKGHIRGRTVIDVNA